MQKRSLQVGGQASFDAGLGDLIVKAATSAAGFRSAALAARSGTLDRGRSRTHELLGLLRVIP